MSKVNCKDCSQSDCAYFGMDNKTTCKDFTEKTKTAQRQWVGLTGQQKNLIARICTDVFDAIHRTEAKLKEKNS